MDPSKLFRTLGAIAGLAGIALGVVLLIFQGVLATKFLPSTGLDTNQAYHVLVALMVLIFGLAGVGIVAWLIFVALPKGTALPQHNIYVLAALLLAVLMATVVVASGAFDRSTEAAVLPPVSKSTIAPSPSATSAPPTASQSPGPSPSPSAAATPAPSPSPSKQDVTRSFRVCMGEYEKACDPHDSYLYCGVDPATWAKGRCDRFKIQQLNSRDGNKCGYTLFEVLCTSSL